MKSEAEWKWVLAWAVGIVILASVPYLYGIAITPSGYHFLGFTHNIDDAAVYLSWMRQATDGHYLIRNLFTNDLQSGRAFNWMFFKMGVWSKVTGMSLVGTYHLARILLGIILMFAVWQFSKLFLVEPDQRRVLIPLLGLSSGIGWLIPGVKPPLSSVDEWQPEAITFLSIYLNPLFLAGMLLMLAAFYFLMLGHRTGRSRYALLAGISLLVLGNVHTYDVLTVAAVWVTYLLVSICRTQSFPRVSIVQAIPAGIIATPSLGYQFYLYSIDPVFRARANTPAVSPPIWSFLTGYGLVLLGAIIGIILALRQRRGASFPSLSAVGFLASWSVVGFVLPYVPVAQQRKLVMGLHFPLCILCAYAIAILAARIAMPWRRAGLIAFIALTGVTNVRFAAEDIAYLAAGTTAPGYQAYFSTNQMKAMAWLRKHTSLNDTILGPPSFSLFVPALAGRQVYYGHWSETPDYASKIREWLRFEESASGRHALIEKSRASCLVIEGEPIASEAVPRTLSLARAFESELAPAVLIYQVADKR